MCTFYYQLLDSEGKDLSGLGRLDGSTKRKAISEVKEMIKNKEFTHYVKAIEISEVIEDEPLGMASVVHTIKLK